MSRNGKARLALVILAAALILSLGLAVSVGSMAIPMGDVYQVMAYELFGLGDGSQWGSGGVHDVVWPHPPAPAGAGGGHGRWPGSVRRGDAGHGPEHHGRPLHPGRVLRRLPGGRPGIDRWGGTALGGNAMGLFGAVGAFLAAAAVLLLSRLGGAPRQ